MDSEKTLTNITDLQWDFIPTNSCQSKNTLKSKLILAHLVHQVSWIGNNVHCAVLAPLPQERSILHTLSV